MGGVELEEAIASFLQEMDFCKSTAATYGCGLRAFLTFITQTCGSRQSAVLGTGCLEDFRRWMLSPHGCGYSPCTVAVYLVAARQFLEWLDINGWLSPAFSLVQARRRLAARHGSQKYRHRPVDRRAPEILAYYDALPLPPPDSPQHRRQRLIILRARALVRLLYTTAAHVGEILALTRWQVQEGMADEIHIVGRDGRPRILSLDPSTRVAIRAYLEERADCNPWLFASHSSHNKTGPAPIGRSTAWNIVKEAVHALKLDAGTSPHTLRHCRAIQLLNEGVSLEELRTFLGHSNITTTWTIYLSEGALWRTASCP